MHFEIHITVKPDQAAELGQVATKLGCKALLINLEQGQPHLAPLFPRQPMLTLKFEREEQNLEDGTVIKPLRGAISLMDKYLELLPKMGVTVVRAKLETEFDPTLKPEEYAYHEAHFKYERPYIHTALPLAKSTELFDGEKGVTYGTLRHTNPLQFKVNVDKVLYGLKEVLKKHYNETVLIDTNPYLDKGWI